MRTPHVRRMVPRPRLRAFFTALGLYLLAALLIGYFGINAYTGDRGLRARQNLDQQIAALTAAIAEAKGERAQWERRVGLLKSDSLGPGMLHQGAPPPPDFTPAPDLVLVAPRGRSFRPAPR